METAEPEDVTGQQVALSLRDVVKRWKGAPAPVLDAVSMDVPAGEIVLVNGRNGAGKTTLLRIAAGMLKPDAGRVEVGGVDPEADRREFQRRIGFLSAGNGALFGRLTVDHHLSLSSALAMLSRDDARRARARVLDQFMLDELRDKRVDRISSGQRQRVRLALAFLHEPDVVLLDEPETSLDDAGLELLGAALGRVRERRGAGIVCSPGWADDRLGAGRRFMVRDGGLVEE